VLILNEPVHFMDIHDSLCCAGLIYWGAFFSILFLHYNLIIERHHAAQMILGQVALK